ncbi:TIGR00266 family protein [Flavobacterium gawalongense]|uniref:TIGR00266 family protein n=1 Tax=Flavobacterium gawalongense TaxID=2594432 RepID=A0A553BTV9_9FLAO|nr:TIGR00266 family protein [Flavobacterium gawalongense]TRX02261.1 TIGR00266 family protein [Flavobacterium gawalongense]TRX07489.1 TIGR00266 family protein [Flavobacterium gawalongense]TRX11662.1 TIGR00266 family protein [Flavobacterium gawalongense]TRX12335.1 TIGR00266 family protein [Flavobacterium gawalongense]TRX30400.1 TIGR00266 family protein [Flavobacterium gawalongense]
MQAHEIDYHIYGEEMQYVEIELDPQEIVIAEAGSFMMMDNNIQMETIFGDGSGQQTGLFGKLLSAGKRVLTGESLFMTAFINQNNTKSKVSFASPYPGKIIPIDLTQFEGKFICQKDSFLCAAKGVSVGIEFSKKLGRGLFGGEGFIMQKIEGDGLAFVHTGGTLAKKELATGEILKVDTGCIVGYTKDVDYDIEFIGGIKNSIFGGEGLFYATLRGPGTVYVQSLPFSRLADRIIASAPKAGGSSRDEGSLLGGLGNLLDGDNRF